jgi:hypothetical protein
MLSRVPLLARSSARRLRAQATPGIRPHGSPEVAPPGRPKLRAERVRLISGGGGNARDLDAEPVVGGGEPVASTESRLAPRGSCIVRARPSSSVRRGDACRRARRDIAARDASSAGMASAVPVYIASGVWQEDSHDMRGADAHGDLPRGPTAPLLPVAPVTRTATQVGDRDDVEIIGALHVHDAVREMADQQMAIRRAAPEGSPRAGCSRSRSTTRPTAWRNSAPSPARLLSYQTTAAANSSDAGWAMRTGFTDREGPRRPAA